MTLYERNVFFKTGIVFSIVCSLFVLAASFYIVPVYPSVNLTGEETRRPVEIIQSIFNWLFDANYFAAHFSLVICILFSIVGLILIYSFFQQTLSPEILYIAIFTVSFSFEAIRLIIPLHLIYNIPSFYLLLAARILLFTRYFGIFSLFAASICAAGLEIQKKSIIILIIFIASLVIIFSVPIDTQNWDTSLNMVIGYASMFRLIEIVIFLTTIISFFVAVNVRGSRDYAYAGIGVMLAFIGRKLLLHADNWASPVLGIILLSAGTWFVCSRLHKIHLWL